MNDKQNDLVEGTIHMNDSAYFLSTIPLLVECFNSVTRETDEAALNIMENIRDILRNNSIPESGISIKQVLHTLEFQDITRQETEKVIASLISLKERLEDLKIQVSRSSAVELTPRKISEQM